MSASACHRRVGRLESEGYIRDYVALVDPRKVDRRTTVFVEITLSGQTDDVLVAFEKSGGADSRCFGMSFDGWQRRLFAQSRGERHG